MTLDIKDTIDKNSDGWEKITQKELKQIINSKEWIKLLKESLESLNNKQKQKIIDWLEDFLNWKKIDYNSSKEDIFAFQILANLNWDKILIDGIYWNQTKRAFDKFENKNKEKYDINIEWAENASEVLNKLIDNILKDYIKKINSKEGLSLKIDDIYNEVLKTLNFVESQISKDNIYKHDIKHIVDNFLKPKEKWKQLIKYVLDISFEKEKTKKEELNLWFELFKSSIWTIFDIAKTTPKEKLSKIIDEAMKNNKIKEIFKNMPELRTILVENMPNIINSINKDEFLISLDNFFNKSKDDLLTIIETKDISKIDNKIKLKVLHNAWQVVDNLIQKDNVKDPKKSLIENFLKWFSNLEFAKKEPVLTILKIINDKNLNLEDRKELAVSASDLIKKLTNPSAGENEIVKSLDNFLLIISKKRDKIQNKELFDNLIKQFIPKESFNEKEDISKNATFFDKIKHYFNNFVDYVKEFLTEKTIEAINTDSVNWLIQKFNGKFIQTLKEKTSYNFTNILKSIRSEISTSINSNESNQENKENKKNKENNENTNISTLSWIIVDKLSDNIYHMFKKAYKEQWNLNKNDIIDWWLSTLRDVLNENKKLVLDTLKDFWVKIDKNDENHILNLAKNILEDPRFKKVLSDIIDNIANMATSKQDVTKQIYDIIQDISKNQANSLIVKQSKNELVDYGIEKVYDLLSDKKVISIIFDNIPELKWKLPDNLTEEKIHKLWLIIKRNIPVELIKNTYHKIDFNNLDQDKIISLTKDILDDKRVNTKNLINSIIDSWIIKDLNSIKLENNREKTNLNEETISNSVDIIYKILNNTDKQKVLKLSSQIWLDKIYWEDLYLVLKNTPKNLLKNDLLKNKDFLNNVINSQENIQSLILNDKKNYDSFINLSVDIAYNSINDKENFSRCLNNTFQKLWIMKFFDIKIMDTNLQKFMGKTIWENIYNLLNSVSKEDLKVFFTNNFESIKKINNKTADKNTYLKMWKQFVNIFNFDKFQKEYKDSKWTEFEKLSLSISDEIADYIKQKSETIDFLVKNSDLINKMIDGNINLKENEKIIREYWAKIFDMMNEIFKKIEKDHWKNYLSSWIDKLSNWQDKSIWNNKVLEAFKDAFIWNNKFFGVWHFLSHWFKIDTWEAIQDYFSDKDHKKDFEDTFYAFAENLNKRNW